MNPETMSERYTGLDGWSDREILDAIWEGQSRSLAAVHAALPHVAEAANATAERLRAGDGRIVYAGAGSSGLIAALDGKELSATFGWPRERVLYLRAEISERPTLVGEDDAEKGRADVEVAGLGADDVVVAVAASGTTPYTVAVARAARAAGALIVAICNRPDTPLLRHADVPVCVETGAEVLAGSTRMNAGSAQKVVLNMLSTLAMTRLGRIHDGLMVEMPTDRAKFSRRAASIVAHIAGCSEDDAAATLAACDGAIKTAVLMQCGAALPVARALLEEGNGSLRLALRTLRGTGAPTQARPLSRTE